MTIRCSALLYTLLLTSIPALAPANAASTGPSASPSPSQLANMTYRGIAGQPVTLVDGEWQGKPFVPNGASRPRVGLVDGFRLQGDLNGDGKDETVTLLWENSGGSGTMTYLAVVGERDGTPVNLATALIGDRVQIRSAAVREGKIVLDVIQAGPKDGACCPSQKARRVWTLTQQGLTESAAEVTGTLSLADLEGLSWVLTQLGQGRPVPTEPAITLRFQDGRISGKGGCNRYFASVKPGQAPGELRISGIGSTRMACAEPVMGLEDRYLAALGKVENYRFLAGQLALTALVDGKATVLLFTPQKAVSHRSHALRP